MEKITLGRKDIGMKHILDIQTLFQKEGSKQIDLPYQLEAVKQYDNVIIRDRKNHLVNSFYQEVNAPGRIVLPSGKVMEFTIFPHQKDENIPEKTYTKWFDYDKILHCLVLRNRKSGDFLTINGSMSKKKVKDYLIQEKVPREELPLTDTIILQDRGYYFDGTLNI